MPSKKQITSKSSKTIKITKTTKVKPIENDEILELFEYERSWQLMNTASLTTITVFEETALYNSFNLNNFYERIAQIIKKNPWLSGRLKLMPEGVQLYYNSNLINCFQAITTTVRFSFDKSYDDIISIIKPYSVEMGKDCIDTNKPLFKVSLLQNKKIESQRKQIILVFSLSRILGDLHTFYKLYEMLDPDSDLITLNPVRNLDYTPNVKYSLGKKEYNYLHYSFISKYSNSFKRFSNNKTKAYTFYFDDENWIPSYKRNHQINSQSKIPFISTNDILTSWFFSLCQCQFGFMSINMRNRLLRLDDNYAGNYTEKIIYRPEDYSEPSLIRQSIKTYKRCNIKSSTLSSLPNVWTSFQNNSCECDNWCTTYKNICLPGLLQVIHIPMIINYEDNMMVKNLLVIFRPTYGTIGGLILTRSERIQKIFTNLWNIKLQKKNWKEGGNSGRSHSNNYDNNNNNNNNNNNPVSNNMSNLDDKLPQSDWWTFQDHEIEASIKNMIMKRIDKSMDVSSNSTQSQKFDKSTK